MLILPFFVPLFPLRRVFFLFTLFDTKTEHIYLIHKAYKLRSSFHHVKGNQDSSITYYKFYLPTQLNVQSEKLAGKFHTFEDFEFHHSVIMIPACPTTFSIQGMDFTRNYWYQIWAYVEPRYEGHMKTNFNRVLSLPRALRGISLIALNQNVHTSLATKVCNDLMPNNQVIFIFIH